MYSGVFIINEPPQIGVLKVLSNYYPEKEQIVILLGKAQDFSQGENIIRTTKILRVIRGIIMQKNSNLKVLLKNLNAHITLDIQQKKFLGGVENWGPESPSCEGSTKVQRVEVLVVQSSYNIEKLIIIVFIVPIGISVFQPP
eukprot:TRINITY_DN9041_c1_g1_i1.p3 TRINITY_DN9041_c1_g1~~TRINITY_DN9041_c1_g1_i1.p3  ORF type:complete len:142 (-),score=4.21 TRINITY_DN9041_c1_g1_i1:415-840(-)